MIVPVVRELWNKGNWSVTVLGLTTAAQVLAKENVPFVGFKDLVQPGDALALEKGRQLMTKLTSSPIDPEESAAYLGLSYQDLVERMGVDRAERAYQQLGRKAFVPMGPVSRLIDRVNPDIVIATNSPRAERASILVAQEREIQTLLMIDLFGLEHDFLFDPAYGDHVSVLSDHVKVELVKNGRRPDQITSAGNPAFDRLADPSLDAAGRVLRRDRGWDGKTVIVYSAASRPDDEGQRRILEALQSTLPAHPNWHLVYRYHPNHPPAVETLGPETSFSHPDEDYRVLFAAADLVVVTVSTTGIEAALLGRPLLKLCVLEPDFSPYDKMGIAFPVNSLDRLEEAMSEILGDTSARRMLLDEQRRLPSVGLSAARNADLIETLVRGRGSPAVPGS